MQWRHGASGDVRLGRQARTDLKWWTALRSHAATGRPIWPGAASMLLDTDASGLGWGAVLDHTIKARGFHGPDRNGLHINCLELGAVTRSLAPFRHLTAPGTVLRLRTDSIVALHVIRAVSSHSPVLMREMRDLYELCAEMQVQLDVEHVSSVLNARADRLSREHDSTHWTLGPTAFACLEARYGPHTINLFASDKNARCPRFYSRWHCPGTLGTSAFSYPWDYKNAWANPPFHQVRAVISNTLSSGAAVTLVAPECRA